MKADRASLDRQIIMMQKARKSEAARKELLDEVSITITKGTRQAPRIAASSERITTMQKEEVLGILIGLDLGQDKALLAIMETLRWLTVMTEEVISKCDKIIKNILAQMSSRRRNTENQVVRQAYHYSSFS